MTIRGKEVRALRAAGHSLTPALIVGRAGLSDDVLAAIDRELELNELIKIKVGKGPLKRKEVAALLPEKTAAEVVQLLGRTILLYRKRPPPTKADFEPEVAELLESEEDSSTSESDEG